MWCRPVSFFILFRQILLCSVILHFYDGSQLNGLSAWHSALYCVKTVPRGYTIHGSEVYRGTINHYMSAKFQGSGWWYIYCGRKYHRPHKHERAWYDLPHVRSVNRNCTPMTRQVRPMKSRDTPPLALNAVISAIAYITLVSYSLARAILTSSCETPGHSLLAGNGLVVCERKGTTPAACWIYLSSFS